MGRPGKLLLIIVCGFLLGAVLYCWELTLTAFQEVTGTAEPARLWSVETKGSAGVELEILGKKWLIRR